MEEEITHLTALPNSQQPSSEARFDSPEKFSLGQKQKEISIVDERTHGRPPVNVRSTEELLPFPKDTFSKSRDASPNSMDSSKNENSEKTKQLENYISETMQIQPNTIQQPRESEPLEAPS